MLATMPMETVRAFPRDSSASMRQLSAEDLDAAQQLISSAQAGREHMADRYSGSPALKYSGSPGPEYAQASTPSLDERATPHGQEDTSSRQKDTSFLGHSCR